MSPPARPLAVSTDNASLLDSLATQDSHASSTSPDPLQSNPTRERASLQIHPSALAKSASSSGKFSCQRFLGLCPGSSGNPPRLVPRASITQLSRSRPTEMGGKRKRGRADRSADASLVVEPLPCLQSSPRKLASHGDCLFLSRWYYLIQLSMGSGRVFWGACLVKCGQAVSPSIYPSYWVS